MQRFIPTGLTVGLATIVFVSLVAATDQASSNLKLPYAIAGTAHGGVGPGPSQEPAPGLRLEVCPTVLDMLNHYDQRFGLGLTDQEKSDLLQYLVSS